MKRRRLSILLFCLALVLKASGQEPERDTPEHLLPRILASRPDTNRIELLLQLGYYHIVKPGEYKIDLDSAMLYLNEAMQLSRKLDNTKYINQTLKLQGDCYLEGNDLKRGGVCFQQVVSYYHQAGDMTGETRTLMRWAECIPRVYSGERIALLKKVLAAIKDKRDIDRLATMKELADIHLNQGKLDLAEQELNEVIAGYRSIGYKDLHFSYDLLSHAYMLKGQFDKALACRLQALDYVNISGDTSWSDYMHISLASIYWMMGLSEKSMSWVDTILLNRSIARCGPELYLCAIHLKNLFLIKKGRAEEGLAMVRAVINAGLADAADIYLLDVHSELCADYTALKEWPKAESACLAAMRIIERLKKDGLEENRHFTNYYFYACKLYTLMHQFRKAEYYLLKIGIVPPGIFDPAQSSALYYYHFKIDSALGRYTSAIRNYQVYTQMHDSIYNTTMDRKFKELIIRQETAGKESSLDSLRKMSRLQRIELNKAAGKRNITVAGIFFTALIAGLAFWGLRQKQQSHRILRACQDEIYAKNTSLARLHEKQASLLANKEWLMQEIHHRVKNNLQMTISLLHMQSTYLSDDEAYAVILNSQRRMQAMSLIHQQLYRSEDMAGIDMLPYIAELVKYLKESFQDAGNINFEVRVEKINLNVSRAVPVGLIINEAVTNAIKYAFPRDMPGRIVVSLSAAAGEQCKLTISDNGIGMPPDFDAANACGSLGMNLIHGLTEQLQGECSITGIPGTTIRLIFPNECACKQLPV